MRRLRVRLFDIGSDSSGARPVARLRVAVPLPPGLEVLPVVFARERAFRDAGAAEVLARHILSERDAICREGNLPCCGLEMDCDWTASSRDGYFRALQTLSDSLHRRGESLHATLRLHQYRSPRTTGIPPADRLTLMAYNMGPVTAAPGRLSVLDLPELRRWLAGAAPYPIPLDVALPLWSWCLQVREGHPIDLLQAIPEEELAGIPQLSAKGRGLFRSREGFFLQGRWIRAGDVLKAETVAPRDLEEAAEILARTLPPDGRREVVYFDLSERNLQRHDETQLDRCLRRLGGAPHSRGNRLRP